VGGLDQALHHLAAERRQELLALADAVDHRAFAECRGEDLALGLERIELRVDQALLVFAEIEEAEAEQAERQHIDREDAAGERREPVPATARRHPRALRRGGHGAVSGRGSDIPPHRGFRSAQSRRRPP
jgi:hypothetical protein